MTILYSHHRQDERLNTEFSQTDFTLDEGEQLLRDMQQLRDVMAGQADIIHELEDRAHQVTPQKQRREQLPGPIPVSAICSYKNANVSPGLETDGGGTYLFIISTCRR